MVPDNQPPWPLARRGRTPAWPPSSPAGRLTSRPPPPPTSGRRRTRKPSGLPKKPAEAAGLEEEFQSPEETAPERGRRPRPPARSHPRDRQRELTVHTTYKEVAPCQKPPAPMPRLPGNEAKTGADPGGPLPGGRDLLDFHGKETRARRLPCPSPDCLKRARKAKALERAFALPIPDPVYDALAAQMEGGGLDG